MSASIPETIQTVGSSEVLPYHRQYDHDLQADKKDSSQAEQGKRIALVALPFISLYKPLGWVISAFTDCARTYSTFAELSNSIPHGDAKEIGINMLNCGLAIASVAGTIFSLSYGMVITSGHDILLNLYELTVNLANQDYKQAADNFINLANSSFYLGSLLTGSLEIIVLSMLTQVAMNAFRSYLEFDRGNSLEGYASLAMTGIRSYQAVSRVQLLRFKWELERLLSRKPSTPIFQTAQNSKIETAPNRKEIAQNSVDGTALASTTQNDEKLKDLSPKAIYEAAALAIRNGDFEKFFALEKECLNWDKLSRTDLQEMTYCLFFYGLDRDDPEKNKIGMRVLERLTLKHPNADTTSRDWFSTVLCFAALQGTADAFEMLKEKHPLWNELLSDNILRVCACLTQPSGFVSRSVEEGQAINREKDKILSLLMEHKNFDKGSPSFIGAFAAHIAQYSSFAISLEKQMEAFEAITRYEGWKNLNGAMLTEILINAASSEKFQNTDLIFELVSEHESWQTINAQKLKEISLSLAWHSLDSKDYDAFWSRMDSLEILTNQSSWKDLKAKDLADIVAALSWGSFRFDFFQEIAKHPQWKNLSSDDIVRIVVNCESRKILDSIILLHPAWTSLDRSSLFFLAKRVAEREDLITLKIISQHQAWKEFTEENLFKIVKLSIWHDNFDEYLKILSQHEKWQNIEKKVEDYIKEKEEERRYWSFYA